MLRLRNTLLAGAWGELRARGTSRVGATGAFASSQHRSGEIFGRDLLLRALTRALLLVESGELHHEMRGRGVESVNRDLDRAHPKPGGSRLATLFSLLGTGELIGLDPVAYLADLLPRLARGITIATELPELMPAAWLARHPQARVPRLNVPRLTEFADD